MVKAQKFMKVTTEKELYEVSEVIFVVEIHFLFCLLIFFLLETFSIKMS